MESEGMKEALHSVHAHQDSKCEPGQYVEAVDESRHRGPTIFKTTLNGLLEEDLGEL